MVGQLAIRREALRSDDLFRRIGEFLAAHRLSPEPGHYAFAYQVLQDAGGPLAAEVNRLADGGVRLTGQDIERMGGRVSAGAPVGTPSEPDVAGATSALVARTQDQIESFATVIQSVQDETRGFGRDLAMSHEEIRRSGSALELDDIVELTGVMLGRVRATERRLDAAMEESRELRQQLAAASGAARRDPLTELANRRALEEAFAAATPGDGLLLAICDVDRFKAINDTFGHGVGDRVLKTISRTLAEHCAPHLVARHGGEEFAVLFTGATTGDAHGAIEAARVAIAGRRLRVRESDAPLGVVTFSAGIGPVVPGETFDTAFARVDRALYRAKAEGRDRVALTDAPAQP